MFVATTVLFCAAVRVRAQAPLTLHAAVAQAIAASPAARASADQVAMQRGLVRQAGLRPNPRLFLSSEDFRPWASDFSFSNDTEDFGYVGEIIEIGGKRRKRVAYANAGLARAGAEHELRLREITGRVAQAYWAAAAATAARDLWRQQLADMDEIVRYHRERVSAGAMAGVDLLRMQIERDRVSLETQTAERNAELSRIALAREIGLAQVAPAAFDSLETLRSIPVRPAAEVIEARPDVQAAEDAVREAEADEHLQHALGMPSPELYGGYKRDVGVNTGFGSLQLDLPFFNRNQGEIARASAQRRYAEDSLAAARLAARADVESAVASYTRQQAAAAETLPGMRDRAAENARIVADAYRSGGADLLRYLDSRRTVIEIQLLAIQTLEQYQEAAVQLQLAYGEQL